MKLVQNEAKFLSFLQADLKTLLKIDSKMSSPNKNNNTHLNNKNNKEN